MQASRSLPDAAENPGPGAYTSPGIYNALRERKRGRLAAVLPALTPIPPYCRLPLLPSRHCPNPDDHGNRRRPEQAAVLHSAEWLAETLLAPECPDGNWLRRFRRQALRNIREGVRVIDMGGDSADAAPDTPEEDEDM